MRNFLLGYCYKFHFVLPVVRCDDKKIQEWKNEEVDNIKPKEQGTGFLRL